MCLVQITGIHRESWRALLTISNVCRRQGDSKMNDKELLARFRTCMKNMYTAIKELTEVSIELTTRLGFDFFATWFAWDQWNQGPLRNDIKRGLDSLFERRPELRSSAKELEIEKRVM